MAIADLWKDERARAVLQRHLPQIWQTLDQVGTMSLRQLAPMTQGALDDMKLRAIAADLAALR